MTSIIFKGEESHRFSRFSIEALRYLKKPIKVRLVGREPITSRFIDILGSLEDAVLNGYRRHVVIKEEGTGLIYWAAGTNATSSIATSQITFLLVENQYHELKRISAENHLFIPGLTDKKIFDDDWCFIDIAPNIININNVTRLINMLDNNIESSLLREVALDLRCFADFLSLNIKLQKKCERGVINLLDECNVIDVRIALTELLGYVGSEDSIQVLKKLLLDNDSNDHVVWAAAIALGRISSKDVDNILIDKILQNELTTCKIEDRSQVGDKDWIEAAILLSLARRSNAFLQNSLEQIFADRLSCFNRIITRYACLGLSRLSFLNENSIDNLINGLAQTNNEIELGYFAMALIGSLNNNNSWNSKKNQKLKEVLEIKLKCFTETCIEPDKIWGLEFLAELASSLEDNELASKFHNKLPCLFEDWRGAYYKALSIYEQGESFVQKKDSYESIYDTLRHSIEILNLIQCDNEYVLSTVIFRKDTIIARLNLLENIEEWSRISDYNSLNTLQNNLQTRVINELKKYCHINKSPSEFNRISEHEGKSINHSISRRETDRINETIDIVELQKNYMYFHEIILKHGISDTTENLLQVIKRVINSIYNRASISACNKDIISKLINQNTEIDNVISSTDKFSNKLFNTLNCIQDIISIFAQLSWIMPSHMCIFSGLGRGSLNIQSSFLKGDGTENNPFEFSLNTPIVINVIVKIRDMAAGGTTRASVICKPANDCLIEQDIAIVEGSTTISFIIPQDILSNNISTRIDFVLRFISNDIIQDGDKAAIFVRRSSC